MGMTVLYIAFGFVALWLLAEVLMQYKARLRWRLLAFAGFVGVVAGVVLPSVPVIAVGATAFAVGQTLVTLSFRKGFVAGWALRRGGEPVRKGGRRRSGGAPRPPRTEPALEVTALEYGTEGELPDYEASSGRDAAGRNDPDAGDEDVFTPQPVPEETGSYGIQSFAPQTQAYSEHPAQTAAFASPFTTAEQDAHQFAAYYDQQGQGGYDYSTGYPGAEQQVYAAYSDPYIGTGGVAPQQEYDYTAYGDYGRQQYSMDTPPGGVWVPQQRDAAQPYPAEDQQPPQQPQGYPYQGDPGGYEQYRY
ncbi:MULTISPECIES: hypothetical protein [unclassified Streptomyces]|uniref:hypothetical protein n=1 Tax=unclassified Streptomyces TaxID=2593676 RepID=UPI002E300324|nr:MULTISPECIES: hypothetical protein [unclassified Streptomyces]WUC66811.1 hypothetical protein OG861_22720 [Streptomyces sp. NBC_00539]